MKIPAAFVTCCELTFFYSTAHLLCVQRTYQTYERSLRGSVCISVSFFTLDKKKYAVFD